MRHINRCSTVETLDCKNWRISLCGCSRQEQENICSASSDQQTIFRIHTSKQTYCISNSLPPLRISYTESEKRHPADSFTSSEVVISIIYKRSLTTMSKGSLLRGGASDTSLASLVIRYLTETTTEQSPPPTSNKDDKGFLVMATIIVIFIVLSYAYCMYQVVRHFCCSRRDEVQLSGSILVDQGVVFSLNPAQRRAVLEIIFSEMSKVRLSGRYSSVL